MGRSREKIFVIRSILVIVLLVGFGFVGNGVVRGVDRGLHGASEEGKGNFRSRVAVQDTPHFSQVLASANDTNSTCLLGYYIYAPENFYETHGNLIVWRIPPNELEADHISCYRIRGPNDLELTYRLTTEEKLRGEGDYWHAFVDPGWSYYITLENELNFALARTAYNMTVLPWKPETKSRPWINLLPICLLVCFSALFSGLTLGLLSLDKVQLQVIIDAGKKREKKYAKAILPFRRRGNWLLCTLLLGNVMVNAALSILSADVFDGTIGFISSSALIVVFGEIIPQAICARKGLLIGYYTRHIVLAFMILLFPLAYPISVVLDFILGREIGQVYSRGELKQLLRMHAAEIHGDLTGQETKMLSGAIDLSEKTVEQIMTPIADVYSLNIDAKLNSEVITQLLERGHSRIPIFENNQENIIGLVFLKDFALVNPELGISVRSLLQYYGRPLHSVFQDASLSEVLNTFKQGGHHLAIVHRVNDSDPTRDPFYENLGIVTLEDILEELIQDEIVDEYDEFVDMRGVSKQPQRRIATNEKRVDYAAIKASFYPGGGSKMTRQQLSSVLSYLSKSIPLFGEKYLTTAVLENMLSKTAQSVEIDPEDGKSEPVFYRRGEVYSYFMILVQGRAEIRCGSEEFMCDGGPFTYFAIDSLRAGRYVCDFTARALSPCLLLKISKDSYVRGIEMVEVQREQRDEVTTPLLEDHELHVLEKEDRTPSSSASETESEESIEEMLEDEGSELTQS